MRYLIPFVVMAVWLVACKATNNLPPGEAGPPPKSWSEPPAMTIDPSRRYAAVLHTNKGDIRIELLAADAPQTVNSFVFLARQGFYDGVTFHRVIPGFVAQGGDPTGTGTGGPGYMFRNEDNKLSFNQAGMVAMANAGRNTNGSQFFITYAALPHLNGGYTIFGRVVAGMDVATALTPRDPDAIPEPPPGDRIESVAIEEG